MSSQSGQVIGGLTTRNILIHWKEVWRQPQDHNRAYRYSCWPGHTGQSGAAPMLDNNFCTKFLKVYNRYESVEQKRGNKTQRHYPDTAHIRTLFYQSLNSDDEEQRLDCLCGAKAALNQFDFEVDGQLGHLAFANSCAHFNQIKGLIPLFAKHRREDSLETSVTPRNSYDQAELMDRVCVNVKFWQEELANLEAVPGATGLSSSRFAQGYVAPTPATAQVTPEDASQHAADPNSFMERCLRGEIEI